MKAKLGSTGLLLLLSGFAFAGTTSRDLCTLADSKPESIVEIDQSPSYFAKVTPDGHYMAFILGSGNYILDLREHHTSVHVPGPYDPVPTPDGRFAVIPINEKMSFFKLSQLLASEKPGETVDARQVSPAFSDPNLSGNYQSIGIMRRNGKKIYRVIVSGQSYNDYILSPDGTLSPDGPTKTLCTGMEALRLPMLSKDGKLVAGFFSATNTTKIYRLQADGSCEEMLDLGVATGKVEFSYDGKAIAFHVDTFNQHDPADFFSGVDSNVVKNIYVAELDRSSPAKLSIKSIRPLTHNTTPGVGSYYPSFTADGKVAYIHGEKGKYSFRVADPELSPAAPYFLGSSCQDCRGDAAAAIYALGSVWSRVCQKAQPNLTATDAALWSLSMDPETCRDLVNQKWSELKSTVSKDEKLKRADRVSAAALDELDEKALLAACPEPGRKTAIADMHRNDVSLSGRPNAPLTGQEVFNRRCRSCHSVDKGNIMQLDWSHLSPALVDEMIRRIQSTDPNEHMPKDAQLDSGSEEGPLLNALREMRRQ